MDINDLTYLINGAVFEVHRILIELKTVDKIEKINEAQLLNYLKATGINVGLLVNFKSRKADIKRLVLDLPE